MCQVRRAHADRLNHVVRRAGRPVRVSHSTHSVQLVPDPQHSVLWWGRAAGPWERARAGCYRGIYQTSLQAAPQAREKACCQGTGGEGIALGLYDGGELQVRLCSMAGVTLTGSLPTFHQVLPTTQGTNGTLHKSLPQQAQETPEQGTSSRHCAHRWSPNTRSKK